MHVTTPRARTGLLAAATALLVVLVAAPGASAASFDGGPYVIDFKTLAKSKKLKVTTTGASPKTSTGGTFVLGSGTMTMTNLATGSIAVGTSTSSIKFTAGKKSVTLTTIIQKLSSGKGTISARVNGKSTVTLFDVKSAGQITANDGFSELRMTSSKLTLTSKGASALNSALGLKAPKKGQKDTRLKSKASAGTASFNAKRSLTVVGGQTRTVYDVKFVEDLRKCDISLGAVGPATAIPKEASSAPEGGVELPVNAQAGGTLTADTLIGQVSHLGGTVLDRPGPGQPGNTTGKAAYNSPLTNFVFGFGPPAHSLTAFVVNSNNNLPIGSVTGTPVATLTDTGGSVSLQGGALVLSDAAAGTLSQAAPPLGADCPIPAGSKIGSITMNALVE